MTSNELRKVAKQYGDRIAKETPDSVGYVLVLHDFRGETGKQTEIVSNFATEFIPNALQLSNMDIERGQATEDQTGREPRTSRERGER